MLAVLVERVSAGADVEMEKYFYIAYSLTKYEVSLIYGLCGTSKNFQAEIRNKSYAKYEILVVME